MLTKILLTIAFVVAVWRLAPIAQQLIAKLNRPERRDGGGRERKVAEDRRAIDLVRCPRCGAYTPAGQRCDCSG